MTTATRPLYLLQLAPTPPATELHRKPASLLLTDIGPRVAVRITRYEEAEWMVFWAEGNGPELHRCVSTDTVATWFNVGYFDLEREHTATGAVTIRASDKVRRMVEVFLRLP